jgi:ABC-type uncharacterized transport system permease subunit
LADVLYNGLHQGYWSTDGSIEKLGWLAVALVIFATWKRGAVFGALYLFGALFGCFLHFGTHVKLTGNLQNASVFGYVARACVVALRKKRGRANRRIASGSLTSARSGKRLPEKNQRNQPVKKCFTGFFVQNESM